MKSKEKVYDYTNCSCKYYCADCVKNVPITVITLEDKK